jgi:hypothetical protein
MIDGGRKSAIRRHLTVGNIGSRALNYLVRLVQRMNREFS